MPSDSGSAPRARTDSLALLEISSIARGYVVADALVKAAAVTLVTVEPVTPGKMLILYHGSVAELETAEAAGLAAAGTCLIDRLLLPLVHRDVTAALRRRGGSVSEALGILECGTVSSGLLAADAAAKASDARLLEIHAARGIGGKTTILLTGILADVNASLDAGSALASERGTLIERATVARAHPDLRQYLESRAAGEGA